MEQNGQKTAAADLALISACVREAGQIALGFFGRNPKVWLKDGNSPVSEADFAADAYLKEKLLAARPDYGWISEETADDRPPAAYKRSFIVDPIDGTRGFIRHKPQWCVSVAVVEDGRPIAGALDCPALGEHWTAAAGEPALLDGVPLEPGGAKAEDNVSAGNLPKIACQKAQLEKLPAEFTAHIERAAHIPSLAYRLAMLARGDLAAVLVRPGCHDWDIAAADLILSLSGGRLTSAGGAAPVYGREPFCHGFLLAARADNQAQMLDIVSAADLR